MALFPGTTSVPMCSSWKNTHYSEDELNVLDPTNSRKIRFFPMKTASGAVVPNTFVVAMEDYDNPATYNSFINFVGIISNVKAAPNATAGSTPSSPTGTNPPVMGVQLNETAPGSDTLVFNTIKISNLISPDVVHNTNTITINNPGNQPLVINSLTLSDTNNWALVNPPAPGTAIAGGSSMTITIKFIATTDPSHPTNDQTNDIKKPNPVFHPARPPAGVWTGTLTINSNDPINPTRTVPSLAGYWQVQSEHENEPGFCDPDQPDVWVYDQRRGPELDRQGTEYPNNGNTPDQL